MPSRPAGWISKGSRTLLFLSLALMATTCTDGRSPIEVPDAGPVAQLALAPRIHPALVTEGTADIVRIRVVVTPVGGGDPLGFWEGQVDPNASSWNVSVEFPFPPGLNPQVMLTFELMNASLEVEWSGAAGPISLSVSGETSVANVEIGRGPLNNVGVSSVTISGAPSVLRVGESVQLSATALTAQAGATPTIYWTALNPDVATVSSTGVVQAVSAGNAGIMATAGTAMDQATIQVRPVLGGMSISPATVEVASLEQDINFTAQVLDENGNPVAGEPVTWTSASGTILQQLGAGTFRSKADGTTTVTATSESSPSLSATATVTVKQVATSVVVTPTDQVIEAFGDDVQFSATASDANDEIVASAQFVWTSDDDDIATVGATGLATGTGNGTVTIIAEVGLPAGPATGAGSSGALQGTGVKGEVTLEVKQKVAGVTIDPIQGTITTIGGTFGFEATAFDSNQHAINLSSVTFDWGSSDEGVATVSQTGLATAVAEGTTTIKVEALEEASASPGSSPQGVGTPTGFYAEATLNVQPAAVGTMSGRVLDAATGEPVDGALINFLWQSESGSGASRAPPMPVHSGSNGQWTFPGLTPGVYNILVSFTGYITTTYYNAVVVVNQNTTVETIYLVPGTSSVPGDIGGTIRNAVNALGIPGAMVDLRAGMNNTTGPILLTEETLTDGTYMFFHRSPGIYTITARATGFTEGRRAVIALGGFLADGQDLVLNPTGQPGTDYLRVVLTWGQTPEDLDAHLTGPMTGGRFHVYFGNQGNLLAEPFALLDVDDTNSFGPETITFDPNPGEPYRYYVHDFTNSNTPGSIGLANSGARVDVYVGGFLATSFFVPAGEGTLWTVFEFQNGFLTPINTLGYEDGLTTPPPAGSMLGRKGG